MQYVCSDRNSLPLYDDRFFTINIGFLGYISCLTFYLVLFVPVEVLAGEIESRAFQGSSCLIYFQNPDRNTFKLIDKIDGISVVRNRDRKRSAVPVVAARCRSGGGCRRIDFRIMFCDGDLSADHVADLHRFAVFKGKICHTIFKSQISICTIESGISLIGGVQNSCSKAEVPGHVLFHNTVNRL